MGESGPFQAAAPGLTMMARRLATTAHEQLKDAVVDPIATEIVDRLVTPFNDLLQCFVKTVVKTLAQACGADTESEASGSIALAAAATATLLHEIRDKFAEWLPAPTTDGDPRRSSQRLVVLTLDLARYTEKASAMTEMVDERSAPRALALVTDYILTHVRLACAVGGLPPSRDPVVQTAGDGAVLIVENADTAIRIAVALHREVESRNQAAGTNCRARYDYRIGIGIGYVSVVGRVAAPTTFPRLDLVGVPFIEAARLLASCRTGEVVITLEVWESLTDSELRNQFGPKVPISGKRDEQYKAKRWQVVPPAPWDTPDTPSPPPLDPPDTE